MKDKQTKRLKYIDIARGFAMLIIVLSHAVMPSDGPSYAVYRFLFFINVPIFFVLSGYLFRIKEGETFLEFFKNKFIRIMLPYFVWAMVFLLPFYFFGEEVNSQLSQNASFDMWKQMGNVFYGNGVGNALKQNGPLWFLPALFMTEIIYYFIVYFIKNRKVEIITLIMIFGIGFLCSLFADEIFLPWGLNSALTIGGFFYFGYLMRKWQVFDKLRFKNSKWILIGSVILCGVSIYFNEFDNVIWSDYQYRNYFLTMVAGITSALVIILISKYMGKNKMLEFVGINTMSILIFHKIFIVIAQTKLGGFSEILTNGETVYKLLLSLVVLVVSTAASVLVGLVLRKLCPLLIGEYKKSKRNLA